MSKVLVNRELLERIARDDEGAASLADFEELKRVLAQPAEAEGVSALDELLALFPLKIDKQAFVVNDGPPLTADGDDEFLSFKKVDAALGEIRRLAEQGRATLSAVTAERDRLEQALGDKALCAAYAERQKLRALIAECAEYLNTDRETTIGSGSILHRQMIAAMAAKEA